jgi:hypothetical protein
VAGMGHGAVRTVKRAGRRLRWLPCRSSCDRLRSTCTPWERSRGAARSMRFVSPAGEAGHDLVVASHKAKNDPVET